MAFHLVAVTLVKQLSKHKRNISNAWISEIHKQNSITHPWLNENAYSWYIFHLLATTYNNAAWDQVMALHRSQSVQTNTRCFISSFVVPCSYILYHVLGKAHFESRPYPFSDFSDSIISTGESSCPMDTNSLLILYFYNKHPSRLNYVHRGHIAWYNERT